MIEKDNIRELFSRTLENHTAPVRPEVWNGLQAKMAAAGVSSVGAGAAAKGLSALTKWMIGSAAVAGTAVITTIAVVNSPNEPKKDAPVKPETSQAVTQENLQTPTTQSDGTQVNPAGITEQQPQERTISFVSPPQIPVWGDERYELQEVKTGYVSGETHEDKGTIVPPVNYNPEKPVVIQVTEEPKKDQVVASESTENKSYEAAKVEFPNIFTPNGDNENDEYKLLTRQNIKSIDVIITDTENKVVYRTNDPAFEWDGTYNGGGEPVPDGMYACTVVYKDLGDKTKKVINLLEVKRKK